MAKNTITPNNVYTRTDLSTGKIPAKTTELIMKDFTEGSWVIKNSEVLDMDNDLVKEFSYTTGLPGAYWVSETEKIKTSAPTLVKATLTAKKMAIIIPATEEELNFENEGVFDNLAPKIAKAFYKKLDSAAILGKDTPFVFSIDKAARAAENVVEGDITEDNLYELESLVDESHEVTDFIADKKTKITLKKLTDSKGNRLYDSQESSFDGVDFNYIQDADLAKNTVYAVDRSQTFVGIPKDFTYKILTEGTISSLKNTDGSVVNLGEQDMQALRVTFYVGFMTAHDDAFAVLEPADSDSE